MRMTSNRPSSRRLARVLSSIWNCGLHSEANTPGALRRFERQVAEVDPVDSQLRPDRGRWSRRPGRSRFGHVWIPSSQPVLAAGVNDWRDESRRGRSSYLPARTGPPPAPGRRAVESRIDGHRAWRGHRLRRPCIRRGNDGPHRVHRNATRVSRECASPGAFTEHRCARPPPTDIEPRACVRSARPPGCADPVRWIRGPAGVRMNHRSTSPAKMKIEPPSVPGTIVVAFAAATAATAPTRRHHP